MRKAINVGLTAYGMSGQLFHAPFLATNPGFNLKKVLERKNNHSQERYPGVEVVRNFDELLHDDSIELIVVNTPDHTHFEFCKKAIKAGKHVVVEKPLTVKSNEGQVLIDLANEKNVILSVFQNRRWDSDFLTVKKVIENKLVGRLVEYEAHYDRFRNFIQQNTWKEMF